jgi:hypothetical protein
MSFALAHQSKTNNSRDSKTSAPTSHSSSMYYHHVNNFNGGSPDYIFSIQRTTGNQTVEKLMRSKTGGFDFAKIGIVQPKLKVSQPGDEYEQEADRIAERVMRMPISSDLVMPLGTTKDEGIINRKCAACEMKEKKEEDDAKQLNISRKPSSTVSNLEPNNEIADEVE